MDHDSDDSPKKKYAYHSLCEAISNNIMVYHSKMQKEIMRRCNENILPTVLTIDFQGAVADAVAEAPPEEALMPLSTSEEEDEDSCPRISPFGCCLV
jgi:hypothetical protein